MEENCVRGISLRIPYESKCWEARAHMCAIKLYLHAKIFKYCFPFSVSYWCENFYEINKVSRPNLCDCGGKTHLEQVFVFANRRSNSMTSLRRVIDFADSFFFGCPLLQLASNPPHSFHLNIYVYIDLTCTSLTQEKLKQQDSSHHFIHSKKY